MQLFCGSRVLLSAGLFPVLSPAGLDRHGQIFPPAWGNQPNGLESWGLHDASISEGEH